LEKNGGKNKREKFFVFFFELLFLLKRERSFVSRKRREERPSLFERPAKSKH